MAVTKEHFDRRMDEMLQLISQLQTENKLLRAENKLLKTELVQVKTSTLRTELYTRKNNIIIHGIEAPQGSENLRQTVASFFEAKLGISNANQIRMSAIYRISKKSSRPEPESVLSLRSGTQRKKVVEPIFVSLDGFDRSMIMKECGKLKKTGFSISTDLPAELGKRRKELLSLGYKLKTSKVTAEKVAETRLVQRGVRMWLDVKKSKNSQWAKYLDECFDPVKVPTIQPEELDSES